MAVRRSSPDSQRKTGRDWTGRLLDSDEKEKNRTVFLPLFSGRLHAITHRNVNFAMAIFTVDALRGGVRTIAHVMGADVHTIRSHLQASATHLGYTTRQA